MTLTHLCALATDAAPALANHLWQSTAFAATVWLLTLLLRNNHARIRYTLWLAASIKFLIPFSLLITLGTLLPKPQHIAPSTTIYSAIDTATQPFPQITLPIAPAPRAPNLKERLTAELPAILATIWLTGAFTVLLIWYKRWQQVHTTLKKAIPLTKGRELEILRRLQRQSNPHKQITLLHSQELMEPGIFGIFRPTLLWPARLSDQLEDQHIEAILVHESIHVQRHDNLTAALHMLVEAIFWFHPIVWWMETRMIEERERACDEAVVQQGGNPETYAESLLKACRFCIESPLPCVAGITGADLSRRVRSIMTLQLVKLEPGKKFLLTVLGVAVLAGPVAFGVVQMIPLYVQILHATGPLPSYEVATIKPAKLEEKKITMSPGHFTAVHLSLNDLIKFAYRVKSDDQLVNSPKWMSADFFDVQAKAGEVETEALHKLGPERWLVQSRLMFQSLLADRFQLKVSSKMKDVSAYALVIGKSGPKLKEVAGLPLQPSTSGELPLPPPPGAVFPVGVHPPRLSVTDKNQFTATAVSIGMLADWLSKQPEIGSRMVIDRTGLKGNYDFVLNGIALPSPPVIEGGTASPDWPTTSIFTAVQEQLGLRLIPIKAPTEVLVIEHAEHPRGDAGGKAPPPQSGIAAPNPLPQTTTAKSPAFEVVSARPSKPDSKVRVGTTPGGYSETNLPLKAIISNAYGIRQDLISGAPSWTESTAYDINAKEDESTAAAMQKLSNEQQGAQIRLMLQALLADRFHLKVTRVTKEAPIYQLAIAKGGFKLKEADPKNTYANGIKGPDGVGTGVILTGSGQVTGQAIPISMLATNLSYQVDRSVVDKTGLTGRYDFTLKWAPDQTPNGTRATDNSGPSLFTALQEQLGLKLEPAKGPVESLVVEHIERPTEN